MNSRYAKIIFYQLISLLLANLSFAQIGSDTIYLNSNWEKASSDNYEYSRVLTKELDSYSFKDYWKSGDLHSTGQLSLLSPEKREGECRWYYQNGNLQEIRNYKNNEIIGLGQIFDTLGRFDFHTVYAKDSLDNASEFHKVLNKIGKNLRYPAKCQNLNIDGKVIAKFYIDNFGKLKGFSIAKSVYPELDNEAKRVILSCNKWPVPKYKKTNVHILIYQPILFFLPD